jgi:hypothetical protein
MISGIPENSLEFRFPFPESQRLISVGNLGTLSQALRPLWNPLRTHFFYYGPLKEPCL